MSENQEQCWKKYWSPLLTEKYHKSAKIHYLRQVFRHKHALMSLLQERKDDLEYLM